MAFENHVGRVGPCRRAGYRRGGRDWLELPPWADMTDGSGETSGFGHAEQLRARHPTEIHPVRGQLWGGGTTGTPAASTGAGTGDATDDPQAEAAEPEAPEARAARPGVGAGAEPRQHSSNKPGRTLVVDVTGTDEDKTKEPEADRSSDRTVADEPVVTEPTPTPTSGKPVAATFAVTADLPGTECCRTRRAGGAIAAVGDITPADGQSTSDPLAPLQATAA